MLARTYVAQGKRRKPSRRIERHRAERERRMVAETISACCSSRHNRPTRALPRLRKAAELRKDVPAFHNNFGTGARAHRAVSRRRPRRYSGASRRPWLREGEAELAPSKRSRATLRTVFEPGTLG